MPEPEKISPGAMAADPALVGSGLGEARGAVDGKVLSVLVAATCWEVGIGEAACWVNWVTSELSWLLKASLVACKLLVPTLWQLLMENDRSMNISR